MRKVFISQECVTLLTKFFSSRENTYRKNFWNTILRSNSVFSLVNIQWTQWFSCSSFVQFSFSYNKDTYFKSKNVTLIFEIFTLKLFFLYSQPLYTRIYHILSSVLSCHSYDPVETLSSSATFLLYMYTEYKEWTKYVKFPVRKFLKNLLFGNTTL